LLGDPPERIPVSIASEQRLSINLATARAIGVSPPWEVINEADLIDDVRRDVEAHFTLTEVMREAVHANLDLAAQRLSRDAGAADIANARAVLLPQIDAGATASVIDQDRAESSFGQVAERTVSGRIGFSQLLFSEPAWANYSVQRHLQSSREEELRALRLDVARDAAIIYLSVLSANTIERIEKDNLKLSRENLELARVRADIGTSGPAEVHRWEAEIANSRQNVIRANSRRNIAEIELNRLLNRPLEEPFILEEVALDDPALILDLAPPFAYAGSRQNFKLLREFLTMEATKLSPEIARLDAAIAARERHLKSQARQYFAPTIALQGQIGKTFDESGAGSNGGFDLSGLPPELSALGDAFPEPADDLDWQIGLGVSLPLFKGGSRYATHRKARRKLEEIELQRAAVAERIEQAVRSALHTAGASYASIRLSREAADAAAKTRDIVSDAYGRGAVSILDLLDAQNAALVTEEAAAIAVFQFLSDYMQSQRSVGRFTVFMTYDERRTFVERLERFVLENGGHLPER
jgi:outer membrane protein TolC